MIDKGMYKVVIILTQILMNLNWKLVAETVDRSAEAADNEIQKAQGINRLSKSCPHIPARPAASPEYIGGRDWITYIYIVCKFIYWELELEFTH